jgi:hypothetical protein
MRVACLPPMLPLMFMKLMHRCYRASCLQRYDPIGSSPATRHTGDDRFTQIDSF